MSSPKPKPPISPQTVTDINTLSTFLSHAQLSPKQLATHAPVDVIVICVSAVFHSAEVLFSILQARPDLTKTLVLCGGIGHSTPLIYDAIKNHAKFSPLYQEITGLPEARVLEKIVEKFFDALRNFKEAGGRVLVEGESTNCGANAQCTRELLEREGVKVEGGEVVVVQDSTMSLRTVASFKKVYSGLPGPPRFVACPLLVPEVGLDVGGELVFRVDGEEGMKRQEMWEMNRFCELIMGEIPRLRDDENGYGPKGKGFIVHVDVLGEVEEAWGRLRGVLGGAR
ncbi:hypothetical protein B0J14DRAFT_609153 [Halenospora varia]|nr:hypothetical protein B0J14DRAFT_609153 [Halenospora varia]